MMIRDLLYDSVTIKTGLLTDEFGDKVASGRKTLYPVKVDILYQTFGDVAKDNKRQRAGKLFIYPDITPFEWDDELVNSTVDSNKGTFTIDGVSPKIDIRTGKIWCYEVALR